MELEIELHAVISRDNLNTRFFLQHLCQEKWFVFQHGHAEVGHDGLLRPDLPDNAIEVGKGKVINPIML